MAETVPLALAVILPATTSLLRAATSFKVIAVAVLLSIAVLATTLFFVARAVAPFLVKPAVSSPTLSPLF